MAIYTQGWLPLVMQIANKAVVAQTKSASQNRSFIHHN